MATNTNVTNMKFNKLSSSKYGTITPTEGEFYCTPDDNVVHTSGNENINGIKTFNGSTPIILNNTTGKNCRLQLKDSTTTYGDSGVEIFQATSNNFNQFLIHFMNGNQYPFHIDQNASDSSKFTTYIDKKLVKGFVTTTYKSGTSWYRVWSDGWIEQGGKTASGSNDVNVSVTLNKPFSDTNYYVNLTSNSTSTTFNAAQPNWVTAKTTSGFTGHIDCYGAGGSDWYACGY